MLKTKRGNLRRHVLQFPQLATPLFAMLNTVHLVRSLSTHNTVSFAHIPSANNRHKEQDRPPRTFLCKQRNTL